MVTEYCSTVSESEVKENAFQLIFAFDEIVALGYRENVNMTQIRLVRLSQAVVTRCEVVQLRLKSGQVEIRPVATALCRTNWKFSFRISIF